MKIKAHKNLGIRTSGYLHIPVLYLTVGHDGFVLALPFVNILVSWGEAERKTKEQYTRLKSFDNHPQL